VIGKPDFLRIAMTTDPLRDTEFLASLRRVMLRFAGIVAHLGSGHSQEQDRRCRAPLALRACLGANWFGEAA